MKTLDDLTDRELMAVNIWAEAEGEPKLGQIAVAWVVRNRVALHKWEGSTYRQVIMKPYQFSWTDPQCERYHEAMQLINIPDAIPTQLLYVADQVMAEPPGLPSPVDGATNYFNPRYAHPTWAAQMHFIRQIGHHRFYR